MPAMGADDHAGLGDVLLVSQYLERS